VGPKWGVALLAVANAVLGTALGLFVSAFAQSEFQAVQFMPAFLLPQLLLCGLLTPRENMARPLEIVSWAAPMTYAYDALERVSRGVSGWALVADVLVVCGFIVLALGLGASTLRRRTA
jgi:ABC-2 type transport system permease protein